MTQYSGRTTCYGHKHPGWEDRPDPGYDCIQQVTVFEVQWSNCPVEVEDAVRLLWGDADFGNDHYYYKWDAEDDAENYPVIHEYLASRGVTKCLIHWWW